MTSGPLPAKREAVFDPPPYPRSEGKRRYLRLLTLLSIVLDGIVCSASWWIAFWVRSELLEETLKPINPPEIYLKSLPLVVLGSLLTLGIVRGYSVLPLPSPLEETARSFKGWFATLLYLLSLGFLFKELDLARTVVLLYGAFTLGGFLFVRWILRQVVLRLEREGKLRQRVLIVGAGEIGIRALQKLMDDPKLLYEIVGFLDDDPEKQGRRIGKAPVLGPLSELGRIVREYGVDEVVIAIPSMPQERIWNLLLKLDHTPARVRVVADLFGVLSRNTEVDLIEDVPIYELKGPDASLTYRILKRGFDLFFGAILFLIFCLTFPFIALAIRLDSPGPVFFIQERVGEKGRRFRMWKYRTMHSDTHPYEVAPATAEDPRITRVGRFLRRTSLDELPQVINVLKGEMSIVGPRPEMPFIVEKYNEWQCKRLEVKPGITGLWQILGRKDLPLHENLEYDFYYIKNRSLLLDLIILLKTIPAILRRKGAY
jgi:exopolysaccharide biosynthesis polyprenyl glycosylphosphotransferase